MVGRWEDKGRGGKGVCVRGHNASWTWALGLIVNLWRAASNNVLSISGSFILFVVKPQQLCFTTLCTHDMSATTVLPQRSPERALPIPENMTLECECINALSVTETIHYIFWQYNPPTHTPWTLSSHFELTSPSAVLRCENQPRRQPVSSPLRSITCAAVNAALFTHSADTRQHLHSFEVVSPAAC